MLEKTVVSKYFEMKIKTEEFLAETKALIGNLADKKVLVYGAGASFTFLCQKFNIKNKLNIIGISDKKFNSSNVKEFCGYRTIKPDVIKNEVFDVILVTNEKSKPIIKYLELNLGIPNTKLQVLFNEKIKDEADNYNFLIKNKFDKTLPKLIKKLHNKKVVLYGAGSFLELIKKYFDISKLNVIGISDKRFSDLKTEKEFLGYKAISPNKIKELQPDCVLVSTKFYISIIEDLHYNILKKSKIKIKPLVNKSFMTLFKEIQSMS